MTNITTITAETHEQFESIQKQLLHDGFSLITIEGKRMMYDKWESGKQTRCDIFMKFWN